MKPAVGILFVVTTTLCISEVAAQTADPDVLGVKLGSAPDAAEKALMAVSPDMRLSLYKGTLSTNTFQSPPIVFGAAAMQGGGNWDNLSPAPDKENVLLTFDYPGQSHITAIHRIRYFLQNSAPSLQSTLAALAQKYGKPGGKVDQPIQLYWPIGSAISANDRLRSICGNPSYYAEQMAQGNIQKNVLPLPEPRCGVWIVARITTFPGPPELIQKLDITLTDFKAVTSSHDAFLEYLSTGAAQGAKRMLEEHSTVKPPL